MRTFCGRMDIANAVNILVEYKEFNRRFPDAFEQLTHEPLRD